MQLNDNEVHLWTADVGRVNPNLLERYRTLMSIEELDRNQRYRFARDRDRDCLTRALVRVTLSQYAELPPADWLFAKGAHGKPEIINAPVPLRFNVSHTSRHVVCAVSRRWDIGIDIEDIQRNNDVLAIADRYFSGQEVNDLFALDELLQRDRFFDYWTLKEAYMKARGEGISLGLGNFSFLFNAADSISVSFGAALVDRPDNWYFQLFRPTADHRMALAVKAAAQPVISVFNTLPLARNAGAG